MKNALLLVTCSVGLLAISCNNLTGNGNGAAKDSTGYTKSSETDANKVIGYTNAVVDQLNQDMSYMDRLSDYVKQVDKALHNINDPYAFVPITTPYASTHFRNYGDKNDPTQPTSALSKEDQTFFKSHITVYNKEADQVHDLVKQVADYLTAEDYKDDKSVKGLALLDSIRNHANVMIEQKTILMKRINAVADAAEIVALKDSPLREPITDMKTDLHAVKAFIASLGAHAENYKAFADSAQAVYSALEKAQADHSIDNIDAVKKADKVLDYKNFYDSMHDLLLDAKKILRDASDAGKLTESQLESLDSDYDSLISRYNAFTN